MTCDASKLPVRWRHRHVWGRWSHHNWHRWTAKTGLDELVRSGYMDDPFRYLKMIWSFCGIWSNMAHDWYCSNWGIEQKCQIYLRKRHRCKQHPFKCHVFLFSLWSSETSCCRVGHEALGAQGFQCPSLNIHWCQHYGDLVPVPWDY